MLADPSDDEKRLLSCFPYGRNETILHGDRRIDAEAARGLVELELSCSRSPTRRSRVTYWMNRLQGSPEADARCS